ncbi:hypothetical protein [Streptomyces nigrescens]|uniref:hypothetical protein n=1 Tax=Streptomyces nigrescens TaxID=1920 RepID=UPI0034963A4B
MTSVPERAAGAAGVGGPPQALTCCDMGALKAASLDVSAVLERSGEPALDCGDGRQNCWVLLVATAACHTPATRLDQD